LPWLAKYRPHIYAEFACQSKLDALSQESPKSLLNWVQSTTYHPKDNAAITEAMMNFKPRLVHWDKRDDDAEYHAALLTEILLFTASDEQLEEWFQFLADHDHLRRAIFYRPIPELLGWLRPESVAESARTKADTSEGDSPELEYLCLLGGYGTHRSAETLAWVMDKLRTRASDAPEVYQLVLWLLCAPSDQIIDALHDEKIKPHLIDDEGSRLLGWIARTDERISIDWSYNRLDSTFRRDLVGYLLYRSERFDDLKRWGQEWMECLPELARSDQRYAIGGFYRIEPLEFWAQRHREVFVELAVKCLTDFQTVPRQPFFIEILCLLLPLEPDLAIEIYRDWGDTDFTYTVMTKYKAPKFLAQLWNVDQCASPTHAKLRRELLEACTNDLDIMYTALAAFEGGRDELWELAVNDYLQRPLAKERNLAVSILPWFANEDAITVLENLKSNDPSGWVRDHAAWAYEVAQQERSCRDVYRKALRSRDLFEISAMFEQIKPVLLPTTRWWRFQIEEEELGTQPDENQPKLEAAIYQFWYHWYSHSQADFLLSAFDRKLKDWCRGEQLQSTRPPRLAPWWQPA
jgi:hypothetical protein